MRLTNIKTKLILNIIDRYCNLIKIEKKSKIYCQPQKNFYQKRKLPSKPSPYHLH